jgi:signal transduction histidine kinase
VIGRHGELEQFIHVGMPPETIERIGHLPEGHGLLGALTSDPRPIRLADMSTDPRSSGFPEGHPPMRSFLGVPILVRGKVYGNLYLADRTGAEAFSEEDEELVVSLATTAGFAIENARLFRETERRRQWAAASAETTAQLLAGSPEGAVALITARLLELAAADSVFVGLLDSTDPDVVAWRAVEGADLNRIAGTRQPTAGTYTARLMRDGRPALLAEAEVHRLWGARAHGFGPVLAVPLAVSGRPIGLILVVRLSGSAEFTEADLDLVADFAGRVAFAFEIQAARAAQDRALLYEDRSRIARDLHDQAIQQLFGMGLQLQGVYGTLPAGRLAEIVDSTVTGLDSVIAHIRTIVFTLSDHRRGPASTSGRQAITDLIGTLEGRLGMEPTLTFVGPVDTVLGPDLLQDVLAVVTEAVMNGVKHGRAEHVEVLVKVQDDLLAVDVRNDGREFTSSGRRSGLANMEDRATGHGGALSIGTEAGRTRLVWTVPVGAGAASAPPARSRAHGTKVPASHRAQR